MSLLGSSRRISAMNTGQKGNTHLPFLSFCKRLRPVHIEIWTDEITAQNKYETSDNNPIGELKNSASSLPQWAHLPILLVSVGQVHGSLRPLNGTLQKRKFSVRTVDRHRTHL
jgi:hypothetical protein